MNRRDLEFFTLTDARLTPLDGGEARRVPLLMLASQHVRLVVPASGDLSFALAALVAVRRRSWQPLLVRRLGGAVA